MQWHSREHQAEAGRYRCTWSLSRHPRCATDTWDIPWAGRQMPGHRACQSHPAAMSCVGAPDGNGAMLPEPSACSQPPPSPKRGNQQAKHQGLHVPSRSLQAHTLAPGQPGHCHPVPALRDTTAAAPAPPAPAPGAQLRPRLPQAEIFRQLPKRGHGSRRCPRVPLRTRACYSPAVPAAPCSASPWHREGAGPEGPSIGQEELSHELLGQSTACSREPPDLEGAKSCLPEPSTGPSSGQLAAAHVFHVMLQS